jgi:hypothetical protein
MFGLPFLKAMNTRSRGQQFRKRWRLLAFSESFWQAGLHAV